MYWVSGSDLMPVTGSLVDCALGLTIARWEPTSALRSEDLPALGAPAMAMWPERVMVNRRRARLCVPRVHAARKRTRPVPANRNGPQRDGWRRPTLPRSRDRSTIGATGLNCRVRNGTGCGPCALVASQSVGAHRGARRRLEVGCDRESRKNGERSNFTGD